MKTTIDIDDALLLRAKKYALRTRQPVRALVEEGLRRVLDAKPPAGAFRLEDRSVGNPNAANPLDELSWPDLRAEIYGER